MIAIAKRNGVSRFSWFWSRARHRVLGSVWRGCAEILIVWPVLHWRWITPLDPDGGDEVHVAERWTGRTRELVGVSWGVTLYLRSPGRVYGSAWVKRFGPDAL